MPSGKRRSPASGQPERNNESSLLPPDSGNQGSRPPLEIVPPTGSLSREIEARREAEERLRLALDGAQMGTWHWDLHSGALLCSAKCLELLGLPPDTKMSYSRLLETLRPEDRSGADEGVRRALAEHSDFDGQFPVRWPDGTWHWIASRGRGYYDECGTPVRMEGVAFDITSLKAAEQAAAEREADLQQAQAIGRIGSWSLELADGEGRHVASPQMYRILGLPENSLPHLTPERFLDFVEPEDRPKVRQAWAEALNGKPYKVQYRTPDNQGARWIEARLEVQFEAERPVRAVGTAQDITDLKMAQEKLAREKLFTDTVIDSVPGLLYLYDGERHLVRWNKQLETLTGYSAEELYNKQVLDWFSPQDAVRIHEAVEQAFSAGQAQAEAGLLTKSGARIPFYFTAHSLQLEGKPYFTGIGIDVSALKRTQQELAARTEELDRFFTLAPELLCIVDQQGSFRRVNPVWERLLGYKVEEMVNHSLFEFVHPDDQEATRVAMSQLTTRHFIYNFVNRYRRKDGDYRWLEWHLVLSGGTGYAAARDITERRQAEEALLRSEEQLRSFVQNAPFGITRATISGDKFLNVNPALVRMLGYESEAEILRLKLSRDIYPEPEDRLRFLAQLPRQGRFRGVEIRWKRRDGSLITVRTSGVCLPDEKGDYDILESIVEDITEHRLLQEQFRQAQKLEAVGRLAGGVAHDFNNMLGVILGYCEIIAMEVGPESPVPARLDVIRQTCERAASLTSQLLAFSRRQVLQPKVVDVNAIVSETERMLRRVIGEDINLNLELAKDLGHVKADPAQLVQIVMNLAINARDAMPQGGLLTIATRNLEISGEMPGCTPVAPGSYVDISVSDTGVGMDRDTQSHIFEPFFTTKPAGKGTGLGLSTVYGIVQQSGGGICVQSEPGKGSTFRICLPRFADPLSPTVPGSLQSKKEAESKTVLLVEDELALRDALATQLELAGYRVLRASQGQEALGTAHNYNPRIDLLITDIVMPQMRGQELAAQLQVIHPETRVLYMSGYADDLVLGSVEGLSFVQKPFRSSEVISKVQKILEPEA